MTHEGNFKLRASRLTGSQPTPVVLSQKATLDGEESQIGVKEETLQHRSQLLELTY